MKDLKFDYEQKINENIKVHKLLINQHVKIKKVINLLTFSLKKGGKLLICGNGGSAADAQHLVAELLIRLKPNFNREPIPAISLAQDSSTITACGNDYDFSDIFLRTFKAFSNKNDILLVISTSGNSKNILKVLKEAKKRKIKSVGFLGAGGGRCKRYCDISIIVESDITARIQECHIFLGHFILEHLENYLIKKIKIS